MINKKKNVNLQLTISKTANDKFTQIQIDLAKEFGFELSKSKIIEYLIMKYKTSGINDTNSNREIAERDRDIYKNKIIALKTALNISYSRLSDLLNIPIACVKNYGTGKQTPNDKNKIVIDEMLKHYGIKV